MAQLSISQIYDTTTAGSSWKSICRFGAVSAIYWLPVDS